MYEITTEWYQQRKVKGKSTTKRLSNEFEEQDWASDVADSVGSFLEEHPRIVFSGMEEFGRGLCLQFPLSLRCETHGDCRAHHIESAREYVEKSVDDLKEGESTDLASGGTKWVTITIRCVPKEEADEKSGPAILRNRLRL
ncbi:hypothetical protein [Streptomyces chattanoogensis]|uniref:hypothetical protein n=1 Tax=Streptomyces chattanoogensis TaxID=66876 RepID=UPI00369EE8C5